MCNPSVIAVLCCFVWSLGFSQGDSRNRQRFSKYELMLSFTDIGFGRLYKCRDWLLTTNIHYYFPSAKQTETLDFPMMLSDSVMILHHADTFNMRGFYNTWQLKVGMERRHRKTASNIYHNIGFNMALGYKASSVYYSQKQYTYHINKSTSQMQFVSYYGKTVNNIRDASPDTSIYGYQRNHYLHVGFSPKYVVLRKLSNNGLKIGCQLEYRFFLYRHTGSTVNDPLNTMRKPVLFYLSSFPWFTFILRS